MHSCRISKVYSEIVGVRVVWEHRIAARLLPSPAKTLHNTRSAARKESRTMVFYAQGHEIPMEKFCIDCNST